jgi:hypothetical protein
MQFFILYLCTGEQNSFYSYIVAALKPNIDDIKEKRDHHASEKKITLNQNMKLNWNLLHQRYLPEIEEKGALQLRLNKDNPDLPLFYIYTHK